jgi:LysR family transcriptional regulator, nitrogen assimilation regulatory protein
MARQGLIAAGCPAWFEPHRIALFLQVAEARSFSKAATRLGLSQTSLSRHVRALEVAAGLRVFYRDGRGVQLTEAGKRLQERARTIMTEVAAAHVEMTSADSAPSGHVTLGMQPAISGILSVPVAIKAMALLPQARLHIMEGMSGHILDWLTTGRVDVALHYDQPNLGRSNAEPLLAQDLLLVGPAKERMTLDVPVAASRLAEVPLVLPGRPHGLRLALDAHAARKGITLQVPIEVDSASSIIGLVAAGVGYSVLPLASIEEVYRAGRVSAAWIAKPRITRTLLMSIAAHKPLTATVRRLMQIIRQEARRISAQSNELGRLPASRAARP